MSFGQPQQEMTVPAIASQMILQDPGLSSNVRAKKQLQEALGPKTVASKRGGGKHVEVLRQEQKQDQDMFQQRYGASNSSFYSNGSRNKRAYQNKLTARPINPTSQRTTPLINESLATQQPQSGSFAAPLNVDEETPTTVPRELFVGKEGVGSTGTTAQQARAPSPVSTLPQDTPVTPITDLINRGAKRVYKISRDKKNKSDDERKLARKTTSFVQEHPTKIRQLARLHSETYSDDEKDDNTLSQDFADALLEHVEDLD